MDTRFLKLKDVAAKLGVSEKTIYRMIGDNQIPFAIKIGGQWRFKTEEIEKWIAAKQATPNEGDTIDYHVGVVKALQRGSILFRIHGTNRDEILKELLAALPYGATFDKQRAKVSILSRESVISSSMQGVAFMQPDPADCVFSEKTLIFLGYLEEAAECMAIDRIKTQAVFLVLAANPIEQAIVDMKLRRLAMEPDFISMVKEQHSRQELFEKLGEIEGRLFG